MTTVQQETINTSKKCDSNASKNAKFKVTSHFMV